MRTHPVGTVVYLRGKVVAHDPGSPWGDVIRIKPVGTDGKIDENGGEYGVNPEHVVTGDDMISAVKRYISKKGNA